MPMSPYIAHLRSLVGTVPLHLPTVATYCRDGRGRVLLVRQRESGRWSLPGGAIEPGERPDEAAGREVKEETGLEVCLHRLRCALGGPDYRTVYANGDELTYVALVYDASVVGGSLEPDGDEVADAAFVERSAFARLDKERFFALVLRDGVLEGG